MQGNKEGKAVLWFWICLVFIIVVIVMLSQTLAESTISGSNASLTIYDNTADDSGSTKLTYCSEYCAKKDDKTLSQWNIYFYANYTNSSNYPINSSNGNGNCTIRFNETGTYTDFTNMTYNSTSFLWQYNRSFTYRETHRFEVNCTSTYSNLTTNDTFEISNTAPVVFTATQQIMPTILVSEDTSYTFNLTANVSEDDVNDVLTFTTNTVNTTLTNYTLNSGTGILLINYTTNDDIGSDGDKDYFFRVRDSGNLEDSSKLPVRVNATNDYPQFINISTEINITVNQTLDQKINASDEEEHYPLFFDVNFSSCELATWSTRTNCTLFSMQNLTNTSTLMNFTPTNNDVGVYTLNVSVMDFGENATLPEYYETNYQQNKTTYSIITLNIYSSPDIDVSDCQNKIANESQQFNCTINITTRLQSESVDIWSNASLRHYNGSIVNESWFFADSNATSVNYSYIVNVSFTPGKTEIGNWSINFSMRDSESSVTIETIYFYVNRTQTANPSLASIDDLNVSINLQTTINITAYDDDILIPDKNESYGGFNENLTFTTTVVNSTGDEVNLTDFNITVIRSGFDNSNITEARIQFTPNASEVGTYNVTINVTDTYDGNMNSTKFTLEILSNNFPLWNVSKTYTFNLTANSTLETTQEFSLNLTDGYFWDPDAGGSSGYILSFTYSTNMQTFNISTDGVINFTVYKQDVGVYNVAITATDDLGLSNSTNFTFNTSYINSVPFFDTARWSFNLQNWNGTENSSVGETLYICDDDLLIRQTSVYDENLTVNLTIQGPNEALFTLSQGNTGSNCTEYNAIFTPAYLDIGSYNITINVTDVSGVKNSTTFNLTIIEKNDPPILDFIPNQTLNLTDILYLDINATDQEDGNDTLANSNLTFSLDVIDKDDSLFLINSTSGVINVTTNLSHIGKTLINVSVNDSGTPTGEIKYDSQIFQVGVYDYPYIVSSDPTTRGVFNIVENSTSNITITTNHSAQDDLNYSWYIDGVLKNSSLGVANGTDSYVWFFTPNFTEETTCSGVKNLTLIFLNDAVSNSTYWNLTINHTNMPVEFVTNIPNLSTTSTSVSPSNSLSYYFNDLDVNDSCTNQTVVFDYVLLNSSYDEQSKSSGNIGVTIVNWTASSTPSITFSYSGSGGYAEYFRINTSDLNDSGSVLTTAQSNNFSVTFSAPEITSTPTSSPGGGSTTTKPIVLKIIMPDPVSAYKKQKIELPISLENRGEVDLYDIELFGSIAKNGSIVKDIKMSFSKKHFTSLLAGKKEKINLTVDINTDKVGTYELTVNATSRTPEYSDWGKLYLTVKEANKTEVEKLIKFTEELLVDNPECRELTEVLKEAKIEYARENYYLALSLANNAIDACRNAISQKKRAEIFEKPRSKLILYLFIAILSAFFIVFIYHFFKRIKLRRKLKGL